MMKLTYYSPCYCGKAPCICRAWDQRLKREKLGHLDYIDPDGVLVPGNKGSGKPKNESVLANRTNKTQYVEWCANVLRTESFTAEERAIWVRHTQGQGNLSIARDLIFTEWFVRTTVNKIKDRARAPRKPANIHSIICRTDPAILALILSTLPKD